MLTQIIIGLCILSLIGIILFVFICIGSALGVLGLAAPLISRFLSKNHDQTYRGGEPINSECYICFQKIKNEVVATCNHSYCGQCVSQMIQSAEQQAIRCPACRKDVIILFRRFKPSNDQQNKLKQIISKYNYKHSKQPSILRSILEIGHTVRNLSMLASPAGLRFILNDPRIKYILLLAAYTFSPFDILPQAILGPLGLIDDGMALSMLMRQITGLLHSYVREQHN